MEGKKFETVDQYIKQFPKDVQVILEGLRSKIKQLAPEAVEVISYGMPTFKLNGKNLVHFAAYKNHIGFYPTPSPIEAFQKELSGYKTSKGAIQFPIDKPLPMDLIERLVKNRVEQIKR